MPCFPVGTALAALRPFRNPLRVAHNPNHLLCSLVYPSHFVSSESVGTLGTVFRRDHEGHCPHNDSPKSSQGKRDAD